MHLSAIVAHRRDFQRAAANFKAAAIAAARELKTLMRARCGKEILLWFVAIIVSELRADGRRGLRPLRSETQRER